MFIRYRTPLGLIAAGLLCLIFSLPALPAAQADETTPVTPSTTNPAQVPDPMDPGRLMLLLDASGSMAAQGAGGKTKIAVAKESLRSVIKSLPEDQLVGFRVFGATIVGEKTPGACKDSQLKVPLGANNRKELLAAIGSYKPYGETPVAYALEQAAKDLGPTGKRSIILVSDGEPSCPQDPCKVAASLTKSGLDLKVDVVGLDVKGKARNALKCIAEKGKGTYTDAKNVDDLTDALSKLNTRPAKVYQPIGDPVRPGPDFSKARPIEVGDWLSKTSSTSQYYELTRSRENSTIQLSATLLASSNASNVEVKLLLPSGDECSTATNTSSKGQLLSVGATAAPVSDGGKYSSDLLCAKSDKLIAVVTTSSVAEEAPLEIRVTEMLPIGNGEELPAPEPGKFTKPTPVTPTLSATGGSSFADAELLEAGSYTGTIVKGETLTFAVNLEWGEALNAVVTLPKLNSAYQKALPGSIPLTLLAYNPARTQVPNSDKTHQNPVMLLNANGTEVSYSVGPVNFLNVTKGARNANMAGNYTLTVSLGESAAGESVPVPFTLDISTDGKADVAPDFLKEGETAPPPVDEDEKTVEEDSGGSSMVINLLILGALAGAGYFGFRKWQDR